MKTKTRESYGEKMARLRAKVEQFSEEYDDDTRAEMMARVLSKDKGYSDRNVMLVLAQMPEAFDVRGYQAWIEDGRIVRHGEHGLEILAFAGKEEDKTEDDGSTKPGRGHFRVAYVYDHSQTEPLSDHKTCPQCVKAKRPWTQS